MMRIRWTPAAAADLEQIKDYLTKKYPRFAQPTVLKLYETICTLKASPHRGRTGREEGTRDLVISPLPYPAVYRVKEDSIEIPQFYHGARERS